jgi:DNA-binding transcriptional LysR family regulator
MRKNPGVRLDWRLVEDPGDLAAGGYDLWLRVGPVADQALIVRPLHSIARGLVATAASGLWATHPDEVAELPAVVLSPYVGAQVALTGPDGATAVLAPRAVASTDHLLAAERLMMAGLGYAILPLWLVSEGLAPGRVVRICPAWSPPAVTLSAVLPQARHRPARVRAFVEHVHRVMGDDVGSLPWLNERLT